MIKSLKSNIFLSLLILFFIAIFIVSPSIYMQACLNGVSIWVFKVLPALFPFFVATRMLILLDLKDLKILDKFCSKAFKTKHAGKIFFLSIISGYPIGAKLICDAYKQGQFSLENAKKMMSFCSVSGPMFIVGSIGIGVFKNLKFGYILLVSHILSAIINGIVFRKTSTDITSPNAPQNLPKQKSSSILSDSMFDSLISILMVGGYIVFSFILIEVFNNLKITSFLSTFICKLTGINNPQTVQAFLNGLIEMTCGLTRLAECNVSNLVLVSISSFLISFGGISIFLQSLNFTKELQIKKPFYLFQKFCQGLWALLISCLLGLIFKI